MKGWRTIVIAAAGVVIGVGNEVTQIVSSLPEAANWTLVASSVLFAVLRVVTTTPIFKQE